MTHINIPDEEHEDYDANGGERDSSDWPLMEWNLTLRVHPLWVADGFDVQDYVDDATFRNEDGSPRLDMGPDGVALGYLAETLIRGLMNLSQYTRDGEVEIVVTSSPDRKLIKKIQGYAE